MPNVRPTTPSSTACCLLIPRPNAPSFLLVPYPPLHCASSSLAPSPNPPSHVEPSSLRRCRPSLAPLFAATHAEHWSLHPMGRRAWAISVSDAVWAEVMVRGCVWVLYQFIASRYCMLQVLQAGVATPDGRKHFSHHRRSARIMGGGGGREGSVVGKSANGGVAITTAPLGALR